MSATASSSATPGKKASQAHLVHHLAALAMLLDEDHVEELLLTISRDNEMVGMFYRRDTLVAENEEALSETYDAAALFEELNKELWDVGRLLLTTHLSRKSSIRRIESAMVSPVGGCGTISGGCAAGNKDKITYE